MNITKTQMETQKEYNELLTKARRQFGQYKRYIIDPVQQQSMGSPDVEFEAVFKELYKPLTGRKPSEKNVAALKKRVDDMTREKAVKEYAKIDSTEEVFIDNFMNLLKSGTDVRMKGLGMSATRTGAKVSYKAQHMSEYAFSWVEDIVKRAIYKNGLSETVKNLDEISEKNIKRSQRLVWILYAEGIRKADGAIDLAEYTQQAYDLLAALKMPKIEADRLVKYMSRNLKTEDK